MSEEIKIKDLKSAGIIVCGYRDEELYSKNKLSSHDLALYETWVNKK